MLHCLIQVGQALYPVFRSHGLGSFSERKYRGRMRKTADGKAKSYSVGEKIEYNFFRPGKAP